MKILFHDEKGAMDKELPYLTQTSPEMGWAHSEAAGRSGGAGAAAGRDCWEGEGA